MALERTGELIRAQTALDVIHWGEQEGFLTAVPIFVKPGFLFTRPLKVRGNSIVIPVQSSEESQDVHVRCQTDVSPERLVALGIGWGYSDDARKLVDDIYFAPVRKLSDGEFVASFLKVITPRSSINTLYLPTKDWPLEAVKGRAVLESIFQSIAFGHNGSLDDYSWEPFEQKESKLSEEARLTITLAKGRLE